MLETNGGKKGKSQQKKKKKPRKDIGNNKMEILELKNTKCNRSAINGLNSRMEKSAYLNIK